MELIDILLLLAIVLIIYIMIRAITKKNKDKENFRKFNNKEYTVEEIITFSNKEIDDKINNFFLEAQFHNDFRDTITALNNLVPSNKQIFNVQNEPVKLTNPNKKEVKSMVISFINSLNQEIKKTPDFRSNNNGWDELIPDPNVQSGHEKQMERLGVASNLYNPPARKSPVKLLAIDHVEKYETDKEIRYVTYLFLKKMNVKDQMLLKVSYVIQKNNIDDERNFFENNQDIHVIIEEFFIVGFMTKKVTPVAKQHTDLYNYEKLENQEIKDVNYIVKELNKKQKIRAREMNAFNNSLDNETKEIKKSAINLGNTDSFQMTRTIYDDLTQPRL
jgi:hypothetical protein